MDQQFTTEEIRDAARIARIYCPGFTEARFESLMELERRMADSNYLEVIQGLLRLEEEKGVSCTEALDACEELLEKKAKLEGEVTDLEERVESLSAQSKQANAAYERLKQDIAKAQQDLEQIKKEYAVAEKRLEAFNKEAEKEKQRIEKEVEDSYQQANITKGEVITAVKIKADVESYGFTLELILDISKEFAGYKDITEKLSKGLKEHGSLSKYLDNLYKVGNKERVRIMAEIAGLELRQKGLADENIRLENVLARLQADIASEEELRRFYRRYAGYSWLLEKLATWEQVYFVRCGNPINKAAGVLDKKMGNPHFWTDRLPVLCPHCGHRRTYLDAEIYQYLNWTVEEPFRLILGE